MDFNLSEEQQLLKDSVDRFILDDYDFEKRRKIANSEAGYSEDNWKTFAELGWLAVGLPEDQGGFGGPVETMIVMEAIGRGLVTEPYLQTVVLGGGFVAEAGSEAQQNEILPAIAEGKCKLSFAYAEPTSRFNLADVTTKAEKANGGYKLSGHKSVVYGAASADKIIVSARTAGGQRDRDGISLFLVDNNASGLSRRDYPTADGLRASEVMLEGVEVSADAMLGDEGQAMATIEKVTDHGIAALCAEAVGCMEVLKDETNEYLKTRKQFGVPIGKFQVLQHRMVDCFIELEQSRSMAYMVTLKLDEGDTERRKAASAAKAQIGKGGVFVGAQSVQMHGGMGMTDELKISHYYKRLMQIDTMFGNRDWQLKQFAALTQ
ncbi:MAG: acyl-CoA dehydrogenase family protein [Minwuia sp.]|uniref:acyl-CoA dehydrogenase family protein n=1 Tax=Minwuia sp. TaxID=2493630 RepID=UPI003A890786